MKVVQPKDKQTNEIKSSIDNPVTASLTGITSVVKSMYPGPGPDELNENLQAGAPLLKCSYMIKLVASDENQVLSTSAVVVNIGHTLESPVVWFGVTLFTAGCTP